MLVVKGVSRVQSVFADNLKQAFDTISRLVVTHPYVALDTEFPGVIRTIDGCSSSYNYISENANSVCPVILTQLKLIQLGLTFSDAAGNLAQPYSTFQINFKFDLTHDEITPNAKELLEQAGVPFREMAVHGVDPLAFSYYFISSGLVSSQNITWICFHGSFDFAYLLKAVSPLRRLPATEAEYNAAIQATFPRIYDLKTLAARMHEWRGGLDALANTLEVNDRYTAAHQACSDSFVTMKVFFAMLKTWFNVSVADGGIGGPKDYEKYCGRIWSENDN